MVNVDMRNPQLNVSEKVPGSVRAIASIASLTGLTQQQIVWDALMSHLGVADKEVTRRQLEVREAAAKLRKGNLIPFEARS